MMSSIIFLKTDTGSVYDVNVTSTLMSMTQFYSAYIQLLTFNYSTASRVGADISRCHYFTLCRYTGSYMCQLPARHCCAARIAQAHFHYNEHRPRNNFVSNPVYIVSNIYVSTY